MAHVRKRHCGDLLKNLAAFSPLVGVLGHRQVGKTTLLESFCKAYETLDDETALLRAKKSAKDFLAGLTKLGTGLDEVQLLPSIFPALKERVRKDKRPGQFILSGSVRFTSRKAIRESLTGRIVYLELLPMVLSELEQIRLSGVAARVLAAKSLDHLDFSDVLEPALFKRLSRSLAQYLKQGGLPGVCFMRNEKNREQKIKDQLETILGRDLHLVLPTTLSYQQILDYVRLLSRLQGEPLHLTGLRRKTSLAENTQKKLLFALESVFLCRSMPIEGSRRGTVIYLEDQAEAYFLAQGQISDHEQFSHAVYRNFRAQFFYEVGVDARFFQYRTRGNALVPFAVQTKEGYLGVLPIREDNAPSRSEILSAQSFLRFYGATAKVLLVHRHRSVRVHGPQIILLPAQILG